MNRKAKWAVYSAVVLGALGAVFLAGPATAAYGGSGDWTINTPETLTGQTLTVSGSIYVYSTFTVTNSVIQFSVPSASIIVYGPSGSLLWGGTAANAVTVTTTNAAQYYNFSIASNAATVRMENVTVDNVWNGIIVSSGTAATRYFADVRITDAVNYGMQLSNSGATLMHIYVNLLISSTLSVTDSYTNYSYGGPGQGYIEYVSYRYRYQYLTATGQGVSVIGGAPWVDGVEVHMPDVSQRIDVTLLGGELIFEDFAYSYGCGATNTYYINVSYDRFYPSVNIYGFYSQNALFAHFAGVRPPPENFSLDIHWSFGGGFHEDLIYYSSAPTCGRQPQVYDYPYEVIYGFNYITFSTNNVIGVYIENGGLSSLNGLNYAMGRVGVGFTSDSTLAQTYIDYFMQYYVTTAQPQLYSLWSVETVTTALANATMPTDFSLTNSYFSGAGVRVDRNFNYNAPAAPGGANDTVFRGTVLVDNVTVVGATGTGIGIRVYGYASSTFNRFDYRAFVQNSTIAASRALSMSLLNQPSINSNYTAVITLRNNNISGGLTAAGSNYNAIVGIDTGGHASTLGSDWYKADVVFDHNTFSNSKGPLVGWGYSSYKFGGGASLTLTNNTFTNVSYYWTPIAGGGRTAGSWNDAFIKFSGEVITIVGNTFRDFSFVYGMLGGQEGANPANEYLAFGYCARYLYLGYGCSWPAKTPTITVTDNTFQTVVMEATGAESAFVLIPGRGHATFDRNVVNDSSATFVHLFLSDYTYYSFPVEDLSVEMYHNTISNQTMNPFGLYTHPYKNGNGYDMRDNVYMDSSSSFVEWKQGWYSNMGYPVNQYGATFTLENNLFFNLSLGNNGAVHLTGQMRIVNNTFDGVSGWAIIAEKMSKIPGLSGNTVIRSANGVWLSPAVLSGIVQTVTYTDLTLGVSGTGIRMENGNLVMLRADFADATTAVDMKNGFAEVYSSRIRVLSGRVQGDASIFVYNNLGYHVDWADASGVDSGVVVKNALVVTSTPDHSILSSGHTDNLGLLAPKTIEVWSMVSIGTTQISTVGLPLAVLVFSGGITTVAQIPQLAPGEVPEFFQDYDAYPILLVDPVVPGISIGKPLAGEVVGTSDVAVQGYTFERGSGIATQRVRIDGGAWINIAPGQSTWTVTLPGIGEGRHVLDAEVSDIATNAFALQMEFFVDITPPVLTLSSPLDESTLTNHQVFDIHGHVEPAASRVTLNGVALGVTSQGDFFYNYSLADGLNVLRFSATDAAGNQVVLGRTIEFDRYAPFLQVDGPINGLLTKLRTVDVRGRSEPDALVTVNNRPAFVNPIDGSFLLPAVLLDDLFDQTENLLVIKAMDRAGNVRFENRSVIVDTKAPAINLEIEDALRAKIEAHQPVSVTSFVVQGTTDSTDAKIRIGGQDVPLTGLSFSRQMVLSEGLNVIRIESSDRAGNERVVLLQVTRDTVKPVLTLETPAEPTLLTNESTLEITGYTDSPDATVYVVYTDSRGLPQRDPVLTVPVGVPVQYRFEYTLVLNPDGNVHVVDVQAQDVAGNFDSARFSYTAKVGKPFLELTGFKTRTTETFVWVNGTTEAGIDTVRINGQDFDVVGQFFAVRWNLPIQDGNYSFSVSVRDAAGNENLYQNRTEVHVPVVETAAPSSGGGFLSNSAVQVGIGAGLFGVALAVLVMAVTRRREVE